MLFACRCLFLALVLSLSGATAPAEFFASAKQLESEHQYDEARRAYENLLDEYPDMSDAHWRLGRILLRVFKDPDTAESHFEAACKALPQECECPFLLSEAYAGQFMKVGVVDRIALTVKAKSALDAAVACDPTSLDYRSGLIQFYLAIPGAGGYTRAHQEADDLAQYDPYAALLLHATLHGYQGERESAIDGFGEAIALRPDDPQGFVRLGDFHFRSNRFDEASEAFRQALERSPDLADAHLKLGKCLLLMNDQQEAVAALEAARTLNPDSTEIAYELGRAQEQAGRIESAIEAYRSCLVLDDPHGTEAKEAHLRLNHLEANADPPNEVADAVMEASTDFFVPLTIAYLAACAGWLGLARTKYGFETTEPLPPCPRPWKELGFAGLACLLLFFTGLAYRLGWLIPSSGGWVRHVTWALNNLIIYSPIALVLWYRRQRPETVFLSTSQLGRKVIVGCVLAIASVLIFLGLRGEWSRFPSVLFGIPAVENLTNFLPVFLEGVVLAFLFVRIRWAMGPRLAILIPSVLFAVGHIPRQIEHGSDLTTMAAFFFINTAIPAAVLFTVARSRDIIWIGIVHYVMDIAIEAFH